MVSSVRHPACWRGPRRRQADAKVLTPEELGALEAMDKLDVINVSYTRQPRNPDSYSGSFTGHSYWYENSWVTTTSSCPCAFAAGLPIGAWRRSKITSRITFRTTTRNGWLLSLLS